MIITYNLNFLTLHSLLASSFKVTEFIYTLYLFTQRKSCIGRLQVKICVSLFVQALNVTYFIVHDVNPYMMKWSFNLSSYSLDSDFSSSCITAQEDAYKSQHETILAKFNRYTEGMCLEIILTDDAIKQMCIWPVAWHNKYKPYNSLFCLPVREEGKQW